MKFLREYFCIDKLDLVKNLVSRNMKLKFRRSYLGFFWSLLVPISMSFTYMLLFSYIMKVQIEHYLPFIIFNVLSWSFFSVACMEGLETVIANYGILIKVPIEVNVFNFSSAVTNAIYFLASLPVVFLFIFMNGLMPNIMYVSLPALTGILFLNTYFLSVLLAIIYVHLRDIKHLFGVTLQLWMYATPIVYPIEMVPINFKFLIYANPMSALYICFHDVLFHNSWPQLRYVAVSVVWTLFLFLISSSVFYFKRNNLLENV